MQIISWFESLFWPIIVSFVKFSVTGIAASTQSDQKYLLCLWYLKYENRRPNIVDSLYNFPRNKHISLGNDEIIHHKEQIKDKTMETYITVSPYVWELYVKWQQSAHMTDTNYRHIFREPWEYSISQEICTGVCCALLCCGYAIVHNEFTWSIYPYSSGLLCWHWGASEVSLMDMGKSVNV